MALKHELWRKKINEYHTKNSSDYANLSHYIRPKNFYKGLEEPTEESCLKLWESALNFAFHEAIRRADKELFEDRAKVWFTDQKEDFTMLCSLIGYDPESVKEVFFKAIEKKNKGEKICVK